MIMHCDTSELLVPGKLCVDTNKIEGVSSSGLHSEAGKTVVLLCCEEWVTMRSGKSTSTFLYTDPLCMVG